MQERYHEGMAEQLAGKQGHQGAIGEMGPSAWRKGVSDTEVGKQLHYDPSTANSAGMVKAPPAENPQASAPPAQAEAAPAAVESPNSEMAKMMEMMKMMQDPKMMAMMQQMQKPDGSGPSS